jgi:tetratricopeptide (TPR) repeat protein
MPSLPATANDPLWPITLLNALRITHYESVESRTAIAQCLLGIDHFKRGAYAPAMAHFEQTLAQMAATETLPLVDALTLGYLGQIYQRRRQHWYALACYDAALETCESEGTPAARYCQMNLYGWLAELCQCCGHDDLAKDYYAKALDLRRQLNPGGSVRSTPRADDWPVRSIFGVAAWKPEFG